MSISINGYNSDDICKDIVDRIVECDFIIKQSIKCLDINGKPSKSAHSIRAKAYKDKEVLSLILILIEHVRDDLTLSGAELKGLNKIVYPVHRHKGVA